MTKPEKRPSPTPSAITLLAQCPRCGAAFTPARPHVVQYFCTPRCRLQANAERQRRRRTLGLMIHLGDA